MTYRYVGPVEALNFYRQHQARDPQIERFAQEFLALPLDDRLELVMRTEMELARTMVPNDTAASLNNTADRTDLNA